jgi:hypothetical protein
MDELNPKARKDVDDILFHCLRPLRNQLRAMPMAPRLDGVKFTKTDMEKAAVFSAKAMRNMPACFWIKLFEIAQQMTNPILHTLNCTNWVSADDKCKAGYEMSDCRRSCADYEGEKADYSDELDCDGQCLNRHGGPADA